MTNNEEQTSTQRPLFLYGTETWKDIEGYENLYQVSSSGKVRSLRFNKIKLLKSGTTLSGYRNVSLRGEDGVATMYYVHRLVANAFITNDNPSEKIYVNHINHLRDCNHVENLEWVTPAQNIDMIARQRMSETRIGKANLHLRKAIRCKEDSTTYDSITDCARIYNINHSTLSAHLRGKTKTCKGLHFEYA